MSQTLGANGNELTITIPSAGERDWATSIRDNCFQLISDHSHEGSGLGKKLRGYLALDQTEAVIANNTTLKGRNNAGNGGIDILKVDASDEVVLSTTIASAEFQDDGLTIVDNGDNTKKVAVDVSGVTTATTRTLTIPDVSGTLVLLAATQTLTNKSIDSDNNTITNIVNADIKAAAGITLNKLAALTASEMVITDGSGVMVSAPVATYPSLTELAYLKGATSSVQTQIDAKISAVTGTTDEIAITSSTIVGLANNPVIPGTDSMVVPVGTTAQQASTTAGAFRYNSDNNIFEGYSSGAWGQIGGGGGGLDSLFTDDFEITSHSDFTSGNAATPDAVGTGTLDGTLATETTTELNGSQSISYTSGSSSANDFFLNDEDITCYEKHQQNFLGISFHYTYSGDDDDIRFLILDQDDAELTSSTEYLKSKGSSTRFSTSVYIPDGTTGLRYGFQVVTGNNTKELVFDDIELSSNPYVYKNLSNQTEWATESGITIGATTTAPTKPTTVDVEEILWRRDGSDLKAVYKYYAASTSGATNGSGQYLYTLPNGLSFDTDHVEFDTHSATTVVQIESGNSVGDFLVGDGGNILQGYCVPYNATQFRLMGDFEAGERIQNDGSSGLATAETIVIRLDAPIDGWKASSEHVITPAKSNMVDWTSYSPTISGVGTPSTEDFTYKITGDSVRIRGYVVCGTVAASTFSVTLPSGLTIDSTKVSSTANTAYVGILQRFNNGSGSGTEGYASFVDPAASTTLIYAMKTFGSDTLFDKENGNSVSQTGDALFLDVEIPVVEYDNDVNFLAAVPVQQTCYIKDVKATTTDGGTFTSGAWQTRDLNDLSGDTGWVSLSSNQFTLDAGKYEIEVCVPAVDVDYHQAVIYNITDSTFDVIGTSAGIGTSSVFTSTSDIKDQIEISSSKTYEIQHRCSSTKSTLGFGSANSFGQDEVYTQVKITKVK